MPSLLIFSTILFLNFSFSNEVQYKTYFLQNICNNKPQQSIKLGAREFSAAILEATSKNPVEEKVDCSFNITANEADGIIVSLTRMSFSGDCASDYINFSSLNKNVSLCQINQPSLVTQRGIIFLDKTVHLRFKSNSASTTDLKLVFTAYMSSSCTDSSEYACANKACIWRGLICDGENNCGDNSDESQDQCDSWFDYELLTLILVILAVPFVVLGLKISIYYCNRGPNILAIAGRDPRNPNAILSAVPVYQVQPETSNVQTESSNKQTETNVVISQVGSPEKTSNNKEPTGSSRYDSSKKESEMLVGLTDKKMKVSSPTAQSDSLENESEDSPMAEPTGSSSTRKKSDKLTGLSDKEIKVSMPTSQREFLEKERENSPMAAPTSSSSIKEESDKLIGLPANEIKVSAPTTQWDSQEKESKNQLLEESADSSKKENKRSSSNKPIGLIEKRKQENESVEQNNS